MEGGSVATAFARWWLDGEAMWQSDTRSLTATDEWLVSLYSPPLRHRIRGGTHPSVIGGLLYSNSLIFYSGSV
jgi:hypothetical protein